MNIAQISTPFTSEQVAALDNFQRGEGKWEEIPVHQFTCPNHGDVNHLASHDMLIPTVRGWICQFCDYTQNWAHDFMVR